MDLNNMRHKSWQRKEANQDITNIYWYLKIGNRSKKRLERDIDGYIVDENKKHDGSEILINNVFQG